MSDDNPEPRPRRALIGLLAIVVLIVAVLFIMNRLHQAAQIQDCFASGRTNCAPIETPAR
jgi:type II secretory pathway component PulM